MYIGVCTDQTSLANGQVVGQEQGDKERDIVVWAEDLGQRKVEQLEHQDKAVVESVVGKREGMMVEGKYVEEEGGEEGGGEEERGSKMILTSVLITF